MRDRTRLQVIVGIVVLVFAGGILLSGDEVQSDWLRFYSVAVAAATIALAAWDRWAWHLPVSQKFRSVPRDLRGTWQGTLTTFWSDPVTRVTPAPKTVYLVVRQTCSTISATLLTDESTSRSSMAQIAGEDGDCHLVYSYLNTPENRVEHRSRIHYGSTELHVVNRPATRLKGRYWTNRDSRGELDFQSVSRGRAAEDFDGAHALFESPE